MSEDRINVNAHDLWMKEMFIKLEKGDTTEMPPIQAELDMREHEAFSRRILRAINGENKEN